MPDWKEMYLSLMRETEFAVRILVEAQKKCEEMYLQASEPSVFVLPSVKCEEGEEPEAETDIKDPPG